VRLQQILDQFRINHQPNLVPAVAVKQAMKVLNGFFRCKGFLDGLLIVFESDNSDLRVLLLIKVMN